MKKAIVASRHSNDETGTREPSDNYSGHNVSQARLDDAYRITKVRIEDLKTYIKDLEHKLSEHYQNRQVHVIESYEDLTLKTCATMRTGLREAEQQSI